MTWIKIDDQFFQNPKIIDLSKDAKLLYLCALTYCGSQLTDGIISKSALRVISATVDVSSTVATELVHVGLWEVTEGGYDIHDYLEYNPSKDQVKHDRQQNAKRQQSWRDKKTTPTINNSNNNTDSNAVIKSVSNGCPVEIPYRSRIDPNKEEEEGKTTTTEATGTPEEIRFQETANLYGESIKMIYHTYTDSLQLRGHDIFLQARIAHDKYKKQSRTLTASALTIWMKNLLKDPIQASQKEPISTAPPFATAPKPPDRSKQKKVEVVL